MRSDQKAEKKIEKKAKPKTKASGDFILVAIVISLVIFGVIMVFSASYYTAILSEESQYKFLKDSLLGVAAGLVAFVIGAFIKYDYYRKFAIFLMLFGLVLLGLLFTNIAVEENGAVRWIPLFGGITLMPTEVIKICVIIFTAWYFTRFQKYSRNFLRGYSFIFLLTIVLFLAIYKLPSLTSAFTVAGIMLLMSYFAGAKVRYILGMLALGAAGFAAIVTLKHGEHAKRFWGYLTPFDDYTNFHQLIQSLLALGSGGVFGLGPGKSVQKALYLPYAHTDFIFAIIGEEFGLVGCIVLMLSYLLLIWRCILIAVNAPDRFGMLLASGITALLALHTVINIGIVTGLLPPTGIVLPFISYGTNGIVVFLGCMGIMLNISRKSAAVGSPYGQRKREERRKKRESKAAGKERN